VAKSIKKQWREEALSLPNEKRQEFMDYIWDGMTIGEAQEKAGIEFHQAMGILDLNINRHKYYTLNKESV